jgi:hypothetical protein
MYGRHAGQPLATHHGFTQIPGFTPVGGYRAKASSVVRGAVLLLLVDRVSIHRIKKGPHGQPLATHPGFTQIPRFTLMGGYRAKASSVAASPYNLKERNNYRINFFTSSSLMISVTAQEQESER